MMCVHICIPDGTCMHECTICPLQMHYARIEHLAVLVLHAAQQGSFSQHPEARIKE